MNSGMNMRSNKSYPYPINTKRNYDGNNNNNSYFNNNKKNESMNFGNYSNNTNSNNSMMMNSYAGIQRNNNNNMMPTHSFNQQQQQQQHQHRYSTRLKFNKANQSKEKKTAPYNTTQYIMHDYFVRNPLDQECPNEQQQFTDEWNMALANSSNISPIEFSKSTSSSSSSTISKLDNSSTGSSEQMSVDDGDTKSLSNVQLSSSV